MSSPIKLGNHKGPSWTRPSLAGSRSLPGVPSGSLSRDQPILPSNSKLERTTSLYNPQMMINNDRLLDDKRVHNEVLHLEKIVEFLKSQHSDTLHQLHSEIEKLKMENKELHFKLVMCRCNQSSSHSSRLSIKHPQEGERDNSSLLSSSVTNEIKELRNALHHERTRNNQLMKLIDHRIQNSFGHTDVSSTTTHTTLYTEEERERQLPTTIEGCISLINQLKLTNQQQSHELLQLKADLQDLLYSEKWTPDAYLIARAYIPPTTNTTTISTCTNTIGKSKLPQIQVIRRNEKVTEKAYRRLHQSVHLPALKPRPSQLFSERHRRSLSLQRNKLDGFL